jgi:hypothetical protein
MESSSSNKRKAYEHLRNAPGMLAVFDMNELPTKTDSNVCCNAQNVHPILPHYQYDLVTESMSHDAISILLNPSNETQLITFLQGCGIIAAAQQCVYCGGGMRLKKDKTSWFWLCTRRVDGVKCNRGKFSVFDGTFLSKKKLSIQQVLWLIWNFVHHLNEQQCKQYMSIGQNNDKAVVKWYKVCRRICGDCIRKNPPKLGGFGVIVQMDESYFAGAPKYGKGRRSGDESWDNFDKWGFALTTRGSLDCYIQQVDAGRSHKTFMPIINEHCLDGTVFCSDGWKSYLKLAEHLDLEDVVHFPVNHTVNYVDPITGAHTQTVEGLWRHCKEFLPRFGMKPKDLGSYLDHFMWHRYCKQRKLDMFKFFLSCAAELYPPTSKQLPCAVFQESVIEEHI